MIGFSNGTVYRRPIYSVGGQKTGYFEQHGMQMWIQNAEGRRIARITRLKDIFPINAVVTGGTIVPYGLGKY